MSEAIKRLGWLPPVGSRVRVLAVDQLANHHRLKLGLLEPEVGQVGVVETHYRNELRVAVKMHGTYRRLYLHSSEVEVVHEP